MTEATPPDVEQLVNDYANLLNGDFSKLDVLSESFSFHGPGLPEEGIQGRESFRNYLQPFHEAFSDLEYVIDDLLVSDELIMSEWTITGTHDGEFNGIPPTDREIEMNTMSKQVIADGKIQKEWGYYDPHDLMAQLGVEEE